MKTSLKMLLCVFLGFLCGFPIGTMAAHTLYRQKLLSKKQAEFLISFCNMFSPAFLINILFPLTGLRHIFPFFLCLYGIPLFHGIITLFRNHKEIMQNSISPATDVSAAGDESLDFFQTIGECILHSFATLSKLLGVLILVQSFFVLPLHLPEQYMSILIPVLDINSALPYLAKLSPAAVLSYTTFGGFCCHLQVSSIVYDSDISTKHYLFAKISQALCCYILFQIGSILFPHFFI